jgi:hypothetical protein
MPSPTDIQIILLDRIKRAIEDLSIKYQEINSVGGKSDGFAVLLPVGAQTTRFFFDSYHTSPLNLPAGSQYKAPYGPVSILILINEGAADIQYATNQDESSQDISQLLRNGEDAQIPSSGKKIFSLSMRAITTSNATTANVRIGWII